MKPRYLGPMVVVERTFGGAYILAELDGAVSRSRFAAFRLVKYRPRDPRKVRNIKIDLRTDYNWDGREEEKEEGEEKEGQDSESDEEAEDDLGSEGKKGGATEHRMVLRRRD